MHKDSFNLHVVFLGFSTATEYNHGAMSLRQEIFGLLRGIFHFMNQAGTSCKSGGSMYL
jgi:hypothetical protein